MRYAKTEWGINLKVFSMRHGITLAEIAESCGVSKSSLMQVIIGKTPGIEIVPKVDAFMDEYAATHDPAAKRAVTPLDGAAIRTEQSH
jgi:transcriptional regulator with XRE-family HTH domain